MKYVIQKGLFLYFIVMPMSFYGQKIKENDIRKELHEFLISTNDAIKEQSITHPTLFIYDCLNNKIHVEYDLPKPQTGFFRFTTLSPHAYTHFLIFYEGNGYIIKMRRPLEKILVDIITHLKKSKEFTKDMSLFCVKEMVYWYFYNINNEGGVRVDMPTNKTP